MTSLNKAVLLSITYLIIFQLGDTTTDFKLSILFGLCIYLLFTQTINKAISFFNLLFLIVIPVFSYILSFLTSTQDLRAELLFLMPFMAIIGAIFGYGIKKLKILHEYKSAIFAALFLFLIQTSLRKLGEGNYASSAFIVYMFCGIYILNVRFCNKYLSLILILLPFLFLNLIVSFFENDYTGFFLIFPVFLIATFILIFIKASPKTCFHQYFNFKKNFVLLLITILLWPIQENYASWLYSLQNPKINNYYNFKLINSENELFYSTQNKKNVYLFTSAYCGSCNKEYPYYSELAQKYTSDSLVSFYTVYLSFRDQDSIFYHNLKHNKFEFKWSTTRETEKIYSSLKMKGVPYLLIVSNKGDVLYNGYCRIRPWLYINNPQKFL